LSGRDSVPQHDQTGARLRVFAHDRLRPVPAGSEVRALDATEAHDGPLVESVWLEPYPDRNCSSSLSTVETLLSRIRTKLGLCNLVEIAAWARESQLVSPATGDRAQSAMPKPGKTLMLRCSLRC
jgi:hypothetical protein